jgi:hypothetical protein
MHFGSIFFFFLIFFLVRIGVAHEKNQGWAQTGKFENMLQSKKSRVKICKYAKKKKRREVSFIIFFGGKA